VRFIAINNGVDSADQQQSDLTPIINIFNEMYAKDTSKKIRAVFKAKGESGKPLSTNPPYGYIKDPEDKHHWLVDEKAAVVVREIYQLCMSGRGPTQIAKELTRRQIPTPTEYNLANGLPVRSPLPEVPCMWQTKTVVGILSRPEYTGCIVNFKTHKKSYKIKKTVLNDPADWKVFENAHEAIIDKETYDTVQRIRDGRRRWEPMGEMPPLSGMVFCADCGSIMYQVRGRGWTHDKEYFVCATYRKRGKQLCPSHQIRNVVIEEILLQHLREVTAFAREHEDEFVEMVTKASSKNTEKALRESRKEYEQAKARIAKLDTIVQRLYEDNVEGKISDERFMKMSATYDAEQKELESRVSELEKTIETTKEKSANISHFLKLVKQYTDIRDLDAEIIRTFVERINVYKAEKVNGRRQQRIQIIFNCSGEINLPQA
jgi:hypothetical protein